MTLEEFTSEAIRIAALYEDLDDPVYKEFNRRIGQLYQQVLGLPEKAQEATDNSEMVDSKGESSSESHTTSKGHEQTGE